MAVTRQLPANLDAEETVIGACLISEQALETVLEMLKPEHFYRASHAAIFRAMQALYQRGEPVDVLTLPRQLEADHALVSDSFASSNAERIMHLAALVPATRNVKHHAQLVLDAWGKRECISAFTKPMQGAWNGSSPTQVLRGVEDACQALHGLVLDSGVSRVVTALDAATAAQKRVQEGVSTEGAVPPPYPFLDEMMPQRLYVLGGYAKDGKSDVGIQAAVASCKAGVPTGLATIEMPEAEVTNRMIAQFGVPYGPLQRGIVMPAHMDTWREAIGTVGTWPLHFLDDPAADVADISRFAKLSGIKFLVVDHLHRINYEDAYNPRLKLGQNVKQLAILARTLRIPILLLAQLHRSTGYGDGFPRPTMQSFKETSTIEQEASALWAIYRHRDPDSGERTNASDFMVLADRYGSDATHSLHFNGTYQRFVPTDWRHS